jgi:hypothetical protein
MSFRIVRNQPKDDCDRLVEEHGSVFPDDWDYQDIVNFACRYTISNIDDIEGIFEEDEENE